MIPLEVTSCEGCGKCCDRIGSPPGIIAALSGISGFEEDRKFFDSSPDDAKKVVFDYIARLKFGFHRIDQPCLWLDLESRKCRFYDHRPTICREFEMGGKDCLWVRSRNV